MLDAKKLAIRRALLVGSVAAAAAMLSGTLAAQTRRLAIGSNPAGTNFHLVAGGFAKLLQEQLNIPSIVRPYSGSSAYMPLLQRGEIALGVNSAIDSYLAYAGQAPFPVPMTNIRALLGIYPLGYMFWTPARSGLTKIEDLRGKRVVLNYRGLVGLDQLNRAILATGELTEADVITVTSAGLGEGARAVLEGRADAVAMGYRLPLVVQMHAAISGGLRFLTMGNDESQVASRMPGAWVDSLQPGPATVGIEGPIRIANYQTFLNTGTHLPESTAYDIVKAIHTHWKELQRDYTVLAPVESTALAPSVLSHPYHPGAIRYFVDAGMWTPEHQSLQEAFAA